MNDNNYSMLCDFYELTMAGGYFKNGFYKKKAYFDVFFRSIPDGGGFAIVAGLEQVIDYNKKPSLFRAGYCFSPLKKAI